MTARFFIDSLTLTGEYYLVPASKRYDWDEYDVRCEFTHEELPRPEGAIPVGIVSHIEFEAPVDIFVDRRSDEAAMAAIEGSAAA